MILLFRRNSFTFSAKKFYYSAAIALLFRHNSVTFPPPKRCYSGRKEKLFQEDFGTALFFFGFEEDGDGLHPYVIV